MINFLHARVRLLATVVTMLCLLGVSAYQNMARQEDPDFPYRAGMITVIYPGATADAVERLILEPLSDELSQVEELDFVASIARTGVALLTLRFRDAIYDTDSGWDRVRQAMERARHDFPDGIQRMELDDRMIDLPAVVLALRGDESLIHISRQAEQLKRQLKDMPGVSRIDLLGQADEQITIALHDAEMQRLALTPERLAGILASRSQMIPGGFVVVDGRRVAILPNSEFTDLDALRSTQIPLAQGGSVALAAIADIWRGPQEPAQPRAWFDGEQAVLVALTLQRGQVDAIRFGAQLRERVQTLQPEFRPLVIDEMFFQPDQVKQRLDNLELSLLISMLIIVLTLLIGMGWRMGVLVGSMLPVTALISLGLYGMGGGILHQIAVIGMVISMGILIDNAIVMVENVQDGLNQGEPRRHSMRRAIRELAGPLGASTATTMAAFLPLLLARGTTADFTRGIPVMIILTLAVSYLLVISLVPLLAEYFLRPAQRQPSVVLERLSGVAKLSVRHPWWVLGFGVAVVTASLALTPMMKMQFFPNADRPQVVIELFLPEGTDQQRTSDIAAEVEREVRNQPKVVSVHRFVGSVGPDFYYNLPRAPQAPNRARLVVNVEALPDTTDVIHWVREYVALAHPEMEVVADTLAQGPPRLAPVELRVYHADDAQRMAAAEQLFTILKSIPDAVDVRHDIDPGVPALAVIVDDAQAQRFGVGRADVARTLFGHSLGLTVEHYRQELDPIPIVLRTPDGMTQSPEQLLSAYVFNQAGDAVPLAALANVSADWLPASIQRRNGVRLYTVMSGLGDGVSFSQILDQVQHRLAEQPLPPGTRLEIGGDSEGSGDANQQLAAAAPTGLLLLLFFLLLQFNSMRRVAIVLLTVPLAAVGVIPGLVLSGSPFGFQSLLGVIALAGIVLNNAIVLIDVVDQRLADGKSIVEAVEEAVRRRLRPILLTTATTVLGLLPLAFSSSTLWPPMAWAIISGLLASTVLTLLVVPAVCRLTLKPPVRPAV